MGAMNLEAVMLQLLNYGSARAAVEAICSLKTEEKNMVCVLLWDWWTARNKINAGEHAKTTEELCYFIRKHIGEFTSAAETNIINREPSQYWKCPPDNFVKINFDVAFHEQQNDGAFGDVVRTNTGDTIAAGAGKLKHVKSALHAEALACIAAIEGLQILVFIGCC